MKSLFITLFLSATLLFNASVFAGEPYVHHVVLISLKDGITAQQVEEIITVGEALLSDIPGVLEVSINKKAREDRKVHIKDYDLALYVRWETNAVGDVYAPHVLHQSFKTLFQPLLTGIKVIDFYGN